MATCMHFAIVLAFMLPLYHFLPNDQAEIDYLTLSLQVWKGLKPAIIVSYWPPKYLRETFCGEMIFPLDRTENFYHAMKT